MTAVALAPSPVPRSDASGKDQTADADLAGLMAAVQRYLDLMYDCDTSRFDQVFRPTAHLHGFRDGAMQAWSMDAGTS
jgi:hypothetical protein